jgi:hypothetical protein
MVFWPGSRSGARDRRRAGRAALPAARLLPVLAGLVLLGAAVRLEAQTGADGNSGDTPAAPLELVARDRPDDNGGAIVLEWRPSASHVPLRESATGFEVLRAVEAAGPFVSVARLSPADQVYVDETVQNGVSYWYRVAVQAGDARWETAAVGPVAARVQWFNGRRWNLFLLLALLAGALVWGIRSAAAGRRVRVRSLPGIEAMEEAVERAARTQRPILYLVGVEDMNNIQTIATVPILGEVARRAADRNADLRVPMSHGLVMAACQEAVHAAYRDAAYTETPSREQVYYVSDEQFGYAISAQGTMLRDRPAVCLYFGAFFAESLLLAEPGTTTDAVQIAGTAEKTQIPFFLVSCDHVLIGEELFAAAAYLSRDPRLLGTLRGQDFGKVIAIAAILIGCVLATLAELSDAPLLATLRDAVLDVFQVR